MERPRGVLKLERTSSGACAVGFAEFCGEYENKGTEEASFRRSVCLRACGLKSISTAGGVEVTNGRRTEICLWSVTEVRRK